MPRKNIPVSFKWMSIKDLIRMVPSSIFWLVKIILRILVPYSDFEPHDATTETVATSAKREA